MILAGGHTSTSSCFIFFLHVAGTSSVRVDWEHPEELNGVLERYILYLSHSNPNEIGEEAYNSSDTFPYFTLTDLEPGVTYFIRVAVSHI